MNTNRFAGIFRLFIVLCIAALLVGCGGGGGGGDTPTPLPGESTYDLSGTITISGGGVLQGVTMTLSGTNSGTTTTNASGNYSFTGLANGSYTITPTLAGYVFNQVSQAVTVNGANVSDINFIATANSVTTYSISGTIIKSGGGVLQGVTMTLSGAISGTVITNDSGNYTFPGLANGIYTVIPYLEGYTFTPISQAVIINGANINSISFVATSNSVTTYSLSGIITKSSGETLEGVTITLNGTNSGTTTTNASGNYSFTGLTNGLYTVIPYLVGYTFIPINRTVTINGVNATSISFTASSSVGQPNLTRPQAQNALYVVYGGIGYNDKISMTDDALLYRVMVDNMNSIGIDLILKTITGDTNYINKLLGLLISSSVEFTSIGDGYTSTFTINREPPKNGYYAFNASLTVAFKDTGYTYSTGKIFGTNQDTDLRAYFTGHFTLTNSMTIIIRTVKVTAGNGLWTNEGGVTTSYNNWELAYNINYGTDDPMGGLGTPTNLEFIPSSYNTISTQIYPDFRDYTVGGSFTINGNKFSFANGFRYEQEQINEYVMMSANGQLSVPDLVPYFSVSSSLNTINPDTNGTIITHVFEHGAWSSDWRSGNLILGDTSAVFDTGSVTFTGSAGSWTVPDWKTALSIP